MDFSLTEEQEMFRRMMRDFATKEIEPVAAHYDELEKFPADNIRKMALQLSKRRLDVVGILTNGVEIFELTQSAGLKAAGQAVVYPHLLRVTWQFSLPIKTTIICRVCQDDIKQVLDQFQIEIVVVPVIPRS